MDGITFNYSSCLGTATWNYITENKAASTNFKVCSEAKNNVDPINLLCSHNFFSKTATTEENDNFTNNLRTILTTLNVQNLEIFVKPSSPLTQSILVNYEIDNVEQDKVNSLTTTIASVCKKEIENISKNNNCSNTNSSNITISPKTVTPDTYPTCSGNEVSYGTNTDAYYSNGVYYCDSYYNDESGAGVQLVLGGKDNSTCATSWCGEDSCSPEQYCTLP